MHSPAGVSRRGAAPSLILVSCFRFLESFGFFGYAVRRHPE
jgi:hypothetical protein